MKRCVILVVDDDDTIRDFVCAHLVHLGYESVQAKDGIAALEMISSRPIDAIISDQEMPRMTGAELFASVRERGLDLTKRFILMTGSHPPEVFQAHPVLRKPFSNQEFEAALRTALGAPEGGSSPHS